MNELADLKRDVYTVCTEGDGYRVTKFNPDLMPVSFYHIGLATNSEVHCNCPQALRGPCRHLEILETFTELYPERINQGWFYCFETSDWFPPVADAATEDAGGEPSGEKLPKPPEAGPEVENGADQSVTPSGPKDERWGL